MQDGMKGIAQPGLNPAPALDDLTDVAAATPAVGDTIQWDGAKYVNAANATTDEKVKTDAAGTAGYLDALVDNTTLEVDAVGHKIRNKDAGISLAKMADLAQDQFIGRTTASTGVPQTATITAAARTVLDDATVAAMRTTLGLGTGDSPTLAGLILTGILSGALFQTSIKTAGYTLTDADALKVHTNEGATAQVEFTLPTAAASKGPYIFWCQDADGIRVRANTGDTIRVAGNVSSAAGRADSAAIGDALIIVAVNATEWGAIAVVGSWGLA